MNLSTLDSSYKLSLFDQLILLSMFVFKHYVSEVASLLRLYNSPFYIYTSWVFIHPLIDTWVASSMTTVY